MRKFLIHGFEPSTRDRIADLVQGALLASEKPSLRWNQHMAEAAGPWPAFSTTLAAYARAHAVLAGELWDRPQIVGSLLHAFPEGEFELVCPDGRPSQELLSRLNGRIQSWSPEQLGSSVHETQEALGIGFDGSDQSAGFDRSRSLAAPLSLEVLRNRCFSCHEEKQSVSPDSEGPWKTWRRSNSWPKRLYRGAVERKFLRPFAGRPGESSPPQDLAVVSCFFDPCQSTQRAKNLAEFCREFEATGLPLLMVVGEFPGAPRIEEPEYGELLRVPCPSVLWQKERLLNLGIQELVQRGYPKIAWVDADVVPERPVEWGAALSQALDRAPLAQAFSFLRFVELDMPTSIGASALVYRERFGKLMHQERQYASLKQPLGHPHGLSGYAWGARAEVFQRCLLYEAAVIGGADKMMYVASCGSQA